MTENKRKQIKTFLKMKHCGYCHSTENLTIDHKIPKVQGGTDEFNNLQCLCRRCNSNKSGMSDKQVRYIFKWLLQIQQDREKAGKRPWRSKGEKLSTGTPLTPDTISDTI